MTFNKFTEAIDWAEKVTTGIEDFSAANSNSVYDMYKTYTRRGELSRYDYTITANPDKDGPLYIVDIKADYADCFGDFE